MKADLSRLTFQSKKHYHQVIRQQGRVDVDADWNEQQTILNRRIETEANDVIGRSGAPLHDSGFHLVKSVADLTPEEQLMPGNLISPPPPAAGDFLISAGRYYVDGILCENEQLVPFSAQPDLPGPAPSLMDQLANTGFGIVYLDVWLRHITALDDDLIREKALGGPDTATRSKVVWQVKVLPWKIPRPATFVPPPPTCAAALSQLLAQLVPAQIGTLNARTQPLPPDQSLCQLPPSAGFQSLENQLYRVEIHHGGDNANGPTFKWSRDNGSVVTGIISISGNNVVVQNLGPDDVLGFASGQWVEIVDDSTDLGGLPGSLYQIDIVNKASLTITLKSAPPAIDPTLNPKLRRWDQSSTTDLSAGVPITAGWLPLESGIQVAFTADGTYRAGDYWLIPARTATGDIEWPPYAVPNSSPLPQPPRGIQHHYACLGLVQVDANDGLNLVQDCRNIFPPLTEITATTPAASPAIHVQSIGWINDAPLAGEALKGFTFSLDAAPDPASISDATVIVELESPISFFTLSFGLPANLTTPDLPDIRLILKGTLTLKENTIFWMPNVASQTLITECVRFRARGRVRVTLIGSAIWSGDGAARRHLDGRAFADPQLASGVLLPSGSGAAWSDFESWFYVGPQNLGIARRLKRTVKK
jgi:Family of unknown function (DUF6519)